ncbi:MAG: PfkB family carbohydrate kinase [Phycisphaerae bacterium]
MSLLVTGSIGIDTVDSPFGSAADVLGGSAVYFSYAAVQYTPVRLVGVVGEDFPIEHHDVLKARDIDLAGLEVRKGSKTFRWHGKYLDDINERETMSVELNVLEEEGATVPTAYADSKVVFLANTHPELQKKMITQVTSPQTIVLDTMDLWISSARDSLIDVFKHVHGVIINDGEARQLTGQRDLIKAAESMLAMGPRFLVIKKGEHGAMLFTGEGPVVLPAFPTPHVKDPTGAGDSFAGGMLGYIAAEGRDDAETLRRAMVRGIVVASFTIEDFSLRRLETLNKDALNARVDQFLSMMNVS